jgi:2-dehydro-3-deoxyphosphooctonate aldolase (KDO 8-P synthase)
MKAKGNFFLIAGPCVIEDNETPYLIAETVQQICSEFNLPYIFKASYKKANRTSHSSFTGIGDVKALEIIKDIGSKYQLSTTTDIHSDNEADLTAEFVDILQIPAFLCRQTSILEAAGKTGKTVNIKKGQFLSPEMMQFAADKVLTTGNNKVWLTERGTSFGYTDLIVDFRGIPTMQSFGFPVILDCTHSLQQPNQISGITGGRPGLITTIAKAGVAAGVDGIFIETHPEPEIAKSDGANMLPLKDLRPLIEKLVKIREAII